MPATALCIISDREALAWVLSKARMAFPASRASTAKVLRPGDRLLLYTTRGCFHNPGRDRGRVIGSARVIGEVERLREPVSLAGRRFDVGCGLQLEQLAALGTGVELQPMVAQLRVFPDPETWSAWMRRALLRLPDADAELLVRQLARVARKPTAQLVAEYVAAAQ